MKLIKKHQFGGLFESLQKYSLKNNRVPPIGNYERMGSLEPDIKKVPDIPIPNTDNSVKPDALNLNKRNITPIPKSIYTPYNKFLYDGIFTDSSGKPFEYLEMEYNPNTKGVTWDMQGNHTFRKRYLNSLEALNFLDSKRALLLGNNLKYAMKYHQSGGRVLPTAPPAEQRYAGGKRVIRSGKEFGDSVSIRGVEAQSPWYKYPALIIERIRHSKVNPEFNDTTYAERPEFLGFVTSRTRSAGNDYLFGKKIRYNLPIVGGFVNANYDKSTPQEQQEYDTLKKRFNTAWGVAKQLLGGNIEPSDNTRVASGRPLLIPNKIPYGAGNESAGQGPLSILNWLEEISLTSNNPYMEAGTPPVLGGFSKIGFASKLVNRAKAANRLYNRKMLSGELMNTPAAWENNPYTMGSIIGSGLAGAAYAGYSGYQDLKKHNEEQINKQSLTKK